MPGCPPLEGIFLDQIISQPGLEQTEGGAVAEQGGGTALQCRGDQAAPGAGFIAILLLHCSFPPPWHILRSCFPSVQG